jgi:hypothetical protein
MRPARAQGSPALQDPEPTNIDWEDWKTKLEPEFVDIFRAALQRTPAPAGWPLARARCAASPSPAPRAAPGLRIPRYVPSYEAVDAIFEPILDDARALEAHSARRAVELEAELAKVEAELVCAPGPPAAQGF